MFGSSYFGPSYFGDRYWGPRQPVLDTITGVIIANGVLEGFDEQDIIEVDAQLLGTLVVTLVDTGAEGRFAELGFRPSTGLLVYAIDVLDVTDISDENVPEDGHFLMSAVFLEPPGNTLTESGASAGAIGQRVVGTSGDIFTFRRPEPFEVVWYVKIQSEPLEQFLLRFEASEVWRTYRSLPNRALDAQGAFAILDPDKVYEFYGKIVGLTFAQWTFDNLTILEMIDPDLVLERFIDLLATNFGLALPAEDTLAVKRQKIRNAIPTFKLKGLAQSVVLKLRDIGFQGYSREIWVNVNDPDIFEDINDAPAAVQSDAQARGIFDLVQTGSGTKGVDFFEAPHGFFTDVAAQQFYDNTFLYNNEIFYSGDDQFFLSSRLSIHLNELDGDTLPLASLLPETIAAIKEDVSKALRVDTIPVHTDIRQFITDFEVGPFSPEKVRVRDELVISDLSGFVVGQTGHVGIPPTAFVSGEDG